MVQRRNFYHFWCTAIFKSPHVSLSSRLLIFWFQFLGRGFGQNWGQGGYGYGSYNQGYGYDGGYGTGGYNDYYGGGYGNYGNYDYSGYSGNYGKYNNYKEKYPQSSHQMLNNEN